mgnify:CR=1 FL=1
MRTFVAIEVNDQNVLNRSEEHTSELQSRRNLVCRLLLEKKKKQKNEKMGEKQNQEHSSMYT